MRSILFAITFLLSTSLCAGAQASCANPASLPFSFTNGTIADANQVNANNTTLLDCVNSAPRMATADTNASLRALSTTLAISVQRLGFAARGDAPPLLYLPSNAPCSLNSGFGDDGSQVRSADAKCWIARLTFPFVSEWGADLTGINDASAAVQACLNAVGSGGTCWVDPGGSLKLLGNLTLPTATTLDCRSTFSDVEGNGSSAASYATLPALKLDSTKTISAGGDAAAIAHCLIYRNGMTFPVADDTAFAGTGVSSAGFNSFSITDSQVIGFDTCVNTYGGNRVYAQHVYVDCSGVTNAAFYGGNNGDIGYYSHIKAQPLAGGTGGSPAGCGVVRRGTGFKLNADQAQFIDEVASIFWTTGVAFVGGTSVQQHTIGKLWADFPSNIGCSRGSSVGLTISAGGSQSFLHFNHVVLAGFQTGMTINGVDATSDTTFDYLYFGAIGQDGAQFGTAAPSPAGHVAISNLVVNSTPRYAVNMLDTANTSWLDIRAGFMQLINGGAAPYINLPSGLTRSNIHLSDSIKADAPAKIISPSTVSCTGLGASGTCALVASAIPAPFSGVVVLSPAGTPAATGNVTLTLPIGQDNTEGCTATMRDGSGTWPTTTTLKSANASATKPVIVWTTNGAALSAGSTYWINYACTMQ